MSIDYKEWAKSVNEMTESDKWLWVKDNQDVGITVNLDNDDTFVTFDAMEGEEDDDGLAVIRFTGYLGWSDGVHELLEALDIAHEMV